ncbi:hypothetical protein QTI24_28710 [Variovorax sp. J22P240]|uniref:hypothetical protein n=1 Tax=unclassified Variovorax TaxID=663243 RepID=UPI002578A8CE|nr:MULTISPECIES: hypothetical protein [unclassified Variovorax]MDM0002616.1 hypothetical protein [Variovorax sp. J22P240]MDM0047613.1 hypothetical protein [Variovorax sp. J22R115]
MTHRSALVAMGLSVAAGQALSQDVPLTEQDILTQIVGKTIEWKMFDGKIVNVALTPTGKATVSGAYNDVGKWRMDGPGGYCTTWNKAPMNESCVKVVRREGVLVSLREGAVRATVVSAK